MFEMMINVVFALFAIVGIVELFRVLLFRILKIKQIGKLYFVVPMKGHNEEAELVLRSAHERIQWLPDCEAEVLVVDCGMDEETKQICEIASFDLSGIRLCRPDDVEQIICS